RLFQDPAHRRLGDRLDDLQLDGAVGQELGGPARPALRGIRARQGDDHGFRLAVELGRGSAPGLVRQGRLQTLASEPPAVAFHGRTTGSRRGGDLLVCLPLVGQQEDLEVPTTSAIESLALQGISQLGTLFRSQSDEGRLAHEVSPWWRGEYTLSRFNRHD